MPGACATTRPCGDRTNWPSPSSYHSDRAGLGRHRRHGLRAGFVLSTSAVPEHHRHERRTSFSTSTPPPRCRAEGLLVLIREKIAASISSPAPTPTPTSTKAAARLRGGHADGGAPGRREAVLRDRPRLPRGAGGEEGAGPAPASDRTSLFDGPRSSAPALVSRSQIHPRRLLPAPCAGRAGHGRQRTFTSSRARRRRFHRDVVDLGRELFRASSIPKEGVRHGSQQRPDPPVRPLFSVCSLHMAYHDDNLKFKERLAQLYDVAPEDLPLRGVQTQKRVQVFFYCRTSPIKTCRRERAQDGCRSTTTGPAARDQVRQYRSASSGAAASPGGRKWAAEGWVGERRKALPHSPHSARPSSARQALPTVQQ